MNKGKFLILPLCSSILLVFCGVEGHKEFNETEYRNTLKLVSASDSCFKTTVIRSFCWICDGASINQFRKSYHTRCQKAYGTASTVKLLPCPHTGRKIHCYFTCNTVGQKACCPHRYGPLCLKCPEGNRVPTSQHKWPCSRNGICQVGVGRAGRCFCGHRFRGTACEKCRQGYYGFHCRHKCNCVHGYCEGGLKRKCICKNGWTGEYCSKKINNCPSTCNVNQSCVAPGVCRCKPGYEGRNCIVSNLCAPGRNPCGKYSLCSQYYSPSEQRMKTFCRCLPGFEGDGYQCILRNPCLSGFRCGKYEQCITVKRLMPRCVCNSKYERVNGICVPKKCKRPDLCPQNSICVYDSSHINEQICQMQKRS